MSNQRLHKWYIVSILNDTQWSLSSYAHLQHFQNIVPKIYHNMHVKFKACHFVRKALSQMKVSYLDFISNFPISNFIQLPI